jgi:hypothetical protein
MLDGASAAILAACVRRGIPARALRCYASPLAAPAVDVGSELAAAVAAASPPALQALLSAAPEGKLSAAEHAGFAARYKVAARPLHATSAVMMAAAMYN